MITEAILSLIPICAPDVHPNTVAQIIRVESGGNPLAININGLKINLNASNVKEAVQLTRKYIQKGYMVDIGLMQINSVNFVSLGYENKIEKLFEPCTNIAAGAAILKKFYSASVNEHKTAQAAMMGAISAYNTGSWTNGIQNGYVKKVYLNQQSTNSLLKQAINAPTAVNLNFLHNTDN